MLAKVVGTGGLPTFQSMDADMKECYRSEAIRAIYDECKSTGKTGIVAGHAVLHEDGKFISIAITTDFLVYSHIIYLDIPVQVLHDRRRDDTARDREHVALDTLSNWQRAEKDLLRDRCYARRILFHKLTDPKLSKVTSYITKFAALTEDDSYDRGDDMLKDFIWARNSTLSTMIVLDGDKTLAAEDTGDLFWKHITPSADDVCVNPVTWLLKAAGLFNVPNSFRVTPYSWASFRQATILYDEACDDAQYQDICTKVATEVSLYPQMVSLLQMVAEYADVRAIVVTAGLGLIWEKVLDRAGLSDSVKVMGNGRMRDGFVVTSEQKINVVRTLQTTHRLKVWAFGDSVLDLKMLEEADHAIVIVGDESTRSKTMEGALRELILDDDLKARQVLLPATVTPRLDCTILPIVDITSPAFSCELFGSLRAHNRLQVIQATYTGAAKLLMNPMRDARISGPALREAHRRAGWYLATQYLCDCDEIGLEETKIKHVDGTATTAHQFLREDKITIVALMRGGEPMAFGVNDAAPAAQFVHASKPTDLMKHHIEGQITIVLVDSVINSGKTILEFIRHIRNIHAMIRIVVVAGVVQDEFIAGGALTAFANLSLVTLRTSKNKYTGSGSTDTGNRLFNTTHLK